MKKQTNTNKPHSGIDETSSLTKYLKFNSKLFQQLRGTAMGTRPAPTFANLFMAEMDKKLLSVGQRHIHYYKRFIDDIFMIWTASEAQFKEFLEKINGLHETIKFTYNYELKDRSTTFLDTKVSIVNLMEPWWPSGLVSYSQA